MGSDYISIKEAQEIEDYWSGNYKDVELSRCIVRAIRDIFMLIWAYRKMRMEIERLLKVEEEFRGHISFLAVHGFFETTDVELKDANQTR